MKKRGIPLPPRTGSQAQQYFEHLDLAFSSPEERRAFLSRLLEGRKPSPANLLAARLMHPGEGLSDLLVTTNLDDMGPKSLRALGLNPVVLDHPAEIVQRFRPVGSRAVQVLHLHGTCAHSDFCNLRDEIHFRSRKLRPALKALLYSRSPLVVGYSGWEDDAFMKALRARLREAEGALLEDLYWFCYTQDDAAALPNWLKRDPRVTIVAPSSNGADQGRLPAERVFEALLQARAAEKPAVRAVRRPRRPAPATPSAVIAVAEAAVGRGAFSEALTGLRQLSPRSFTAGVCSFYDTVLEEVYLSTRDTAPDLGLEACVMRRAALTLVCGAGTGKSTFLADLVTRIRMARAVYGEGICHVSLDQPEVALLRFDETLALTAAGKDGLRGRHAHALNGKAVALFRAGRTEEALPVWEELLRIEPEADAEVAEALALGRFNLGLASLKLGRAQEATVQWERLAETDFKLAAAPQVRALAERAAASLRLLLDGRPIATGRELEFAAAEPQSQGSVHSAEEGVVQLDEPRHLHLRYTESVVHISPASAGDVGLWDVADTGTPTRVAASAAFDPGEQERFAPSGSTRMDVDVSEHTSASTPAESILHGRETDLERSTTAERAAGARVLAWPTAVPRRPARGENWTIGDRRAGFAPERIAAAA